MTDEIFDSSDYVAAIADSIVPPDENPWSYYLPDQDPHGENPIEFTPCHDPAPEGENNE